MAVRLEVPMTTDNRQALEIELGGVQLRLVVSWVGRTGAWYVDAYTQTGDPIVLGRRLACRNRIWSGRHWRAELPAGDLVVVDTTGQDREPPRDAWESGEWLVLYVED